MRLGLGLGWTEARAKAFLRGWSLSLHPRYAMLRTDHSTLKLTRRKAMVMVNQWPEWERYYLPPFSLKGKTVLDAGAGSGETADFFFTKGARTVVCVEPELGECAMIEENAAVNHWDCQVFPETFKLSHLRESKADFAKIDCEGGESLLLSLDRMTLPMAVEVHDAETREGLKQRGMFEARRSRSGVSMMCTWGLKP